MSDLFTLFADRFGLIGCAAVTAAALAAFFPKKARPAVFAALTAAMFVPIQGYCAANFIFALVDTPSLTLIVGCAFLIFGKKSPLKNAELAALSAVELALILTELDFIPYDLYGWGYRVDAAAAAVGAGILFCPPSRWGIIAAAYLLWRLGIYQNLFDTLVDPIIVIGAAALLIRRAADRTVSRANGPERGGDVRESAPPTPCDR